MKTRLKYWFLVGLLITSGICLSQVNKADSLLKILNTSKSDTVKVDVLTDLFEVFEYEDSEKAKGFLDQAFKIAQKENDKKWLGLVYIYLGYFDEDNANYEDALKNYASALKVCQSIGDKAGIAKAYNSIGGVYTFQGNSPEALKNHLACLKILMELGDQSQTASSYNNIGNVYFDQGNFPEALKNYFLALKGYESAGKRNGVASAYCGIGNVYGAQGNDTEALKMHLSALKIAKELEDNKSIADYYSNVGMDYTSLGDYEKGLENCSISLKIRGEIGDDFGFAISSVNIGNIYLALNNYSKALENYETSLRLFVEMGDQSNIAASTGSIGNVYIKLKKYKEAEVYLLKARDQSKALGHREILKETYHNLATLDSSKGDYKGAYLNHKLFILYRDSIDNEESRKRTIQSQMNYDFEKKEAIASAEHKKELENQSLLADEKSRKQRVILFFVMGSLLLVAVFAGFIFRSLRITRKQKTLIETQKSVVEKQKQEVEHQKHIVEEHQKEIIDSITYARRIQRSLLPTEKYIERNLNRLKKS